MTDEMKELLCSVLMNENVRLDDIISAYGKKNNRLAALLLWSRREPDHNRPLPIQRSPVLVDQAEAELGRD